MKKPENSNIDNSSKSRKEIKEEDKTKVTENIIGDNYPEEGNIMTIGEDRGGAEDSKLVEGGYDDGGYFVE